MISKLRGFSNSKLAGVLVGIIIIPFVFWGMGSVFSGGNTNNVAIATLLVLPPLKTLPMPQNTNGIIIIPTSTPANFEFEKPLNLLIIFYSLYLLI